MNLTWLKKAGLVLGNVATVVAGLGPLTSLFPNLMPNGKTKTTTTTIVGEVESMAGEVVQIETALNAVPGSNGLMKFQAVTPLIGTIIGNSPFLIGKKIQNQALYNKALAGFTQATVDLCNSLDHSTVPGNLPS